MKTGTCTSLSPGRFGFAFGLLWGIGWLLVGWAGALWGYAVPLIRVWGTAYLGYAPTFWGAIIGGVWGFIDFFIFAWLVALVYNCCLGTCKKGGAEGGSTT